MKTSKSNLETTARALCGCGVLVVCAALSFLPRPGLAQQAARQSAVCLDCHDDRQASLDASPHHITGKDGEAARVTCTDCHAGDQRHWEDDPTQYPMNNPAAKSAAATAKICSQCHFGSHQQNMVEGNPHFDADVNCTGCHQVHGGEGPRLLKAAEPDLCYSCHEGVRGQFAKPFRHPVSDGVVRCSECHMSLAERPGQLSMHGTDETCFGCHDEFRGPFPYEHQATVDYSTEEGGCVNCHDPHGSYLPRMLRQPYEPPSYQLCTQCHVIPAGHKYNSHHGDAWANVACSECHADIHGSYTNRLFLSSALESQGCYSVGCHQR